MLLDQQRQALRDLEQLIAHRARDEVVIETSYQARIEAAESEYREILPRLAERLQAERQSAETQYQDQCQAITARAAAELKAAEAELAAALENVEQEYEEAKSAAKDALHDSGWTLSALSEADKATTDEPYKEVQKKVAVESQRMHAVEQEAKKLLQKWRQTKCASRVRLSKAPYAHNADPLREMHECIIEAESHLELMQQLVLPRLFRGRRIVWLFLVLAVAFLYPVGWLLEAFQSPSDLFDAAVWSAHGPMIAGVTLGAALSIGLILAFSLYLAARERVLSVYQPLSQLLFDAEQSRRQCLERADAEFQKNKADRRGRKKQHQDEMERLREQFKQRAADITRQRKEGRRQAEETHARKTDKAMQQRDDSLQQALQAHEQRLASIQERHDAESQQATQRYEGEKQESLTAHDRNWTALVEQWHKGLGSLQSISSEINDQCRRWFPPWNDAAWEQWVPPSSVPPVVRFGEMEVNLARLPNGVPTDPRLLTAGPIRFTMPALLAFPNRMSLLYKVQDAGRTHAVQSLQGVMLRLLTGIPPGKVRFTIIDPVGLGENFAAFMHLADYDEALVASRIWTEAAHIEHRLADLTGHMENVIQKYLRNQFQTIEEYNAHAGEVAEPFRILVVANFPVNFTTEAARRLVSICQSGARCGVYTLISVDTKQPLPQGFNLADLEQPSVNLEWNLSPQPPLRSGEGEQRDLAPTPPSEAERGQRSENGKRALAPPSPLRRGGQGGAVGFLWKDSDFERFPLTLDGPPDDAFCTRELHRIGEKAKEAKRVEVPFEFIAPAENRWWQADSRSGIDVALGRAGATKRQHLRLGHGTHQHVLIAGKTGSGKSTLLHALITNLALVYSPDEVEVYLVDFKKGVEFKTYAAQELPHARVVAIESEREFGLSVLQRLDGELKHRADRFRELGVQDVAGCRDAGQPLPRILLIVDEFQEFFVEDDKLAAEAALLLDRLVRQGRAFGIHVLLGSQTLGGAYSMARATIDQMAVRIALQCSEADGHMILSEDNSAARLLSRPGEAIYNDANGLVEGNNPFQVVWVDDDRRERYLQKVRELDRRRNAGKFRSQIVFEGNAPADITKNPLLHALLHKPSWPEARALQAWLGDAIAIRDPTSALFRRQSGANLMIVGQNDDAALGILAGSMLSFAAQQPPHSPSPDRRGYLTPQPPSPDRRGGQGGAVFYVLDGSPDDSPLAGSFQKLAGTLPHAVHVGGWRDLASIIGEVAEEVDRRQRGHDTDSPPLFLFIHALQRFRDLRKSDDDFGLSGREEEKPSTAKQFAAILRDGPGLGVHALVWCDTLTNLQRTLDRQGMREFELRVLFQMSAGDSSNLIDTPLASKLGLHRALFYSEEQGRLEKFRPYRVPAEEWLSSVKERLGARSAAVGVGLESRL